MRENFIHDESVKKDTGKDAQHRELAQLAKRRRLKLGYGTQGDAAKAAGVSQSIIQRLESRGEEPHTFNGRWAVAELYGWRHEVFEEVADESYLGPVVVEADVTRLPSPTPPPLPPQEEAVTQAVAQAREAMVEVVEAGLAEEREQLAQARESVKLEIAALRRDLEEVRRAVAQR